MSNIKTNPANALNVNAEYALQSKNGRFTASVWSKKITKEIWVFVLSNGIFEITGITSDSESTASWYDTKDTVNARATEMFGADWLSKVTKVQSAIDLTEITSFFE